MRNKKKLLRLYKYFLLSVEYRNQPSPEEVTLYGEVEESNEQEETIDTELKDSSVIIGKYVLCFWLLILIVKIIRCITKCRILQ